MPRASAGAIFPECYNGIPYKRIVEELILLHGGEPQVGNRENTIFRLASDLAKITDRSAPWLESLIPTFGLPEQEWRTTISQVCKKLLETSMSRKLQEAIKRCEAVQTEGNSLAFQGEGRGEGLTLSFWLHFIPFWLRPNRSIEENEIYLKNK